MVIYILLFAILYVTFLPVPLRRIRGKSISDVVQKKPREAEVGLWVLDAISAGIKSGIPFAYIVELLSSYMPEKIQKAFVGVDLYESETTLRQLQSIPVWGNDLCDIITKAQGRGNSITNQIDNLVSYKRIKIFSYLVTKSRSAGIRLALPLGFCFLPAFILVGILPIIVGLAQSIFSS